MTPHPFKDPAKAIRRIIAYYERCDRDRVPIRQTDLAKIFNCDRTTLRYHYECGGPLSELLAPLYTKRTHVPASTYKSPTKCGECKTDRRYVSNGRCVHCTREKLKIRRANKSKANDRLPPPKKDPNDAFAKASYEDVSLWTPYFNPVNLLTS